MRFIGYLYNLYPIYITFISHFQCFRYFRARLAASGVPLSAEAHVGSEASPRAQGRVEKP